MAVEHLVEATARTSASVPVVWELLCATDRYAEWVESTIEVLAADGPAALGVTYASRTRLSGFFVATITWVVAEFDPPNRQVHVGTGVSAVTGLTKELAVVADGDGSLLSITYRYTPSWGVLGRALEFAVQSNVTAEQRRSARTLVLLAEHEAQDGHPG